MTDVLLRYPAQVLTSTILDQMTEISRGFGPRPQFQVATGSPLRTLLRQRSIDVIEGDEASTDVRLVYGDDAPDHIIIDHIATLEQCSGLKPQIMVPNGSPLHQFVHRIGMPTTDLPSGGGGNDGEVIAMMTTSAVYGAREYITYGVSSSGGFGDPLAAYDVGAAHMIADDLGKVGILPSALVVGVLINDGAANLQPAVRAIAFGAAGMLGELTGTINMLTTSNGTMPAVAHASPTRCYALAIDRTSATGEYELIAIDVDGDSIAQVGATMSGALGYDTSVVDTEGWTNVNVATVIDGHFCAAVKDVSSDPLFGRTIKLESWSFDGSAFTKQDTLAPSHFYGGIERGNGCIIARRSSSPIIDVYTYTAAGGFALAFSFDLSTLDTTGTHPEIAAFVYDRATDRIHLGLLNENYDDAVVVVAAFNLAGQTITPISTITGVAPDDEVYIGHAFDDLVVTMTAGFSEYLLMRYAGGAYTRLPATLPFVGPLRLLPVGA